LEIPVTEAQKQPFLKNWIKIYFLPSESIFNAIY
jgi:hypothetical protein